jgi:hypothetical protein
LRTPRDRRRDPRFRASATAIHHITVNGRLLDFSSSGIAVETPSALRVGDRYRLVIAERSRSQTVEGIVRWCRLRATRPTKTGDFAPVFAAGLELTAGPEPSPGGIEMS